MGVRRAAGEHVHEHVSCAPMQRGWFTLAAIVLGCGGPSSAPGQTSTAALVREGEAVYQQYCALCHGARGEGYAADDATRLNGQELLRTASDRFLRAAIEHGREDTAMAAYGHGLGGPLSDAQIDALLALLRSWQEGPSIEVDSLEVRGDADRGAEVWAARCASCHGVMAEGGSAQSLASASFLSTASDGFLRYAIVHGRTGTPMPAFGGVIEETSIDDVVAFLRRMDEDPEAVPPSLAPPSPSTIPLMRSPEGPRVELTLREGRYVAAAQVRDAIAQGARIILLDARPTSAWLRRRIPGAVPVPYYDITPILGRLPRDGTWIVAYCGCPHAASGRVVDRLREAGFARTAVLDEGVHHWIQQGYPTESGPLSGR